MTRCLHYYYSVFSSMEEHLCEEQAESYQLLSEQDRWVQQLRSGLQWSSTTKTNKQKKKLKSGNNLTEKRVYMK